MQSSATGRVGPSISLALHELGPYYPKRLGAASTRKLEAPWLCEKSKNPTTTAARRRGPATSNKLEQTAVGPALAPEGGARSQQFKPEELGAADEWLATNSDDQTVEVRMFKRGEETHVTLMSDRKSLMRWNQRFRFFEWPY